MHDNPGEAPERVAFRHDEMYGTAPDGWSERRGAAGQYVAGKHYSPLALTTHYQDLRRDGYPALVLTLLRHDRSAWAEPLLSRPVRCVEDAEQVWSEVVALAERADTTATETEDGP
jgi:hypothetical protein